MHSTVDVSYSALTGSHTMIPDAGIHPTAIVHGSARLAQDVAVGPWSVVGPDVEIGPGSRLAAHVVVHAATRIGADCQFYPFASVGCDPQDKKYQGERTYLSIGDRNVFRECVTVSRGTGLGGGMTRIADDNLFMAYVHIAHDCVIGSHTIFSNGVTLAGHVTVEDYVILSGFSGAHQFCRIGAHSFLGMRCAASKDVLPYMLVAGAEPKVRGLNLEGLKRRGFSDAALRALKNAYKLIFRQGLLLQDATDALQEIGQTHPEIQYLLDFLQTSERGIMR